MTNFQIKQIGFQKIKVVFSSVEEAKNAQDETGCFDSKILSEIENFKSYDSKYGDIFSSGNIRDDFDSYRVGKIIYIW